MSSAVSPLKYYFKSLLTFAISFLCISIIGFSELSFSDDCTAPLAPALNRTLNLEHETWQSIEEVYQVAVSGWKAKHGFALAERLRGGDTSVERLLRLGFQLTERNGESYVAPPENFSDFIFRYHSEIDQLVASGRIKRENVIYPVISMEVTSQGGHISKRMYRPLVDPMPNHATPELEEDEKSKATIPQTEWENLAASESGFLVDLEAFWYHDLAHFTDLLNPEFMRGIKTYYRKSLTRPDVFHRLSVFERALGSSADKMFKPYFSYAIRTLFIGEFLIMPNILERDLLTSVLLTDIEPEREASLLPEEEIRATVLKMKEKDLASYIERLFEVRESLFTRNGGAAVDPFNLNSNAGNIDQLKEDVFSLLKGNNTSNGLFMDVAAENGLILIKQLDLLREIYFEYRESFPDGDPSFFGRELSNTRLYEFVMGMKKKERSRLLRSVMADLIVRLNAMIFYGLQLDITPVQVVIDSVDGPPSRDSKTYNYFSLAYPRGSVLNHSFTTFSD